MLRSLSVSCLVPALLLLAASPARADDIAVELRSKALVGQNKPALILHANKAVRSARARLEPKGGRALELATGAIRAGQKHEWPLDAPVGSTDYTGTLSVSFADGSTGEMPLSFSVQVGKGLTLEAPEERLRLKKSELDVRLNAPAQHCEYDVTFDGKENRKGVSRFAGEPGGSWLTVSWPSHADDDVVLRILLTCHDKDGFFASLELFPWKLSIPHEDVNFASGKWEIEAGEQGKLDGAAHEIGVAARRYGKLIKVKLYVAGHTDTVGDGGSNRGLSEQRARAIAGYLKKKGVTLPILFAGFGESQLAVPTPDETDERKNRRAEYILSVQPPAAVGWSSL